MSTDAQTRLDWVVSGQQGIKEITNALIQLTKAQKELNTALGKDTKITTTYTKMLDSSRKLKQSMVETKDGAKHLKTEITEVAANTKKANNESKNFLLSWQGVARIIIGSSIARSIGAISRALKTGVHDAAEFQIRISELRTISQQAQLSFGQWSDAVNRLSDEFNRAPLDVAEGLYQTLSNQVAEGAGAIEFMEEALRLSMITVSSAENSVQALTAAINAYGMSTSDARYISDQLFKTVELGRLRLDEIANTIGRVYVLGSQLSISLEEVNASLAALTIQGVRASEAQTLLRNVMLKLVRPTEAMQRIFDSWGVSSGQAAIETFGFIGVINKLEEAVKGGEGELTELAEAFGRIRAITGAAGLVGNIETLEEALSEMRNASESAANAFDIVRESAGFNLQRELQQVSNYFTVELGQKALDVIASLSDTFGGLRNIVKTITETIAKLGIAIGVALGASALITIGKATASLILYANSAGIAATATAALKYQVTALGVSVNVVTLGLAAVAAGLAYAFNEIRINAKTANTAIEELNGTIRNDVINTINDLATEENRLNAERIRGITNVAETMSRTYREAIADQMSALNRLKQLEEDRLKIQDLLYDVKLRTANISEKEELVYKRMLDLRERLSYELAQEEKNWAEINALQSDLTSTYGQAAQFQDKMFQRFIKAGAAIDESGKKQSRYILVTTQGSQRIEEIMQQVTREVEKAANAYERLPSGTRAEIQQIENLIDKQKQSADTIDEARNRAEQIKRKLEETVEVQRELVQGAETWLGKLTEQEQAVTENELYRRAVTLTPIKNEDVANIKQFQNAMALLGAEVEALANSQGTLSVQDVIEYQNALLNLHRTYELYEDFIPLEGMNRFFEETGQIVQKLRETAEAKTELNSKLKLLELGIDSASEATLRFKGALVDLENEGVIASEKITEAATASSQALDTVAHKLELILMNTRIEVQKTEAAIRSLNSVRANSPAPSIPNQWSGGPVKRFADGGSVASDSVPSLLRPGEFVMGKDSARRYFPQLVAMNSGASRFDSGGDVVNNNSVGDINVTVQGGDTSEATTREIANSLRREFRRGTIRLT